MRQLIQEVKSFNLSEIFFLLGWICFAIGLSTSRTLMTISLITIGVSWLLNQGWKGLVSKKSLGVILLCSTVYLVHLIGAFWSEDNTYLAKDLTKKLPLLLLPLLTVSFQTNKSIEVFVFRVFALSLMVSISLNLIEYLKFKWGWYDTVLMDIRDISLFISHIRLSLMIVMVLLWLLFRGHKIGFGKWWNWIIGIYLLGYLFITQSATGLVIFFLVSLVFSLKQLKKAPKLYGLVLVGLLGALLIPFTVDFVREWRSFTEIKADSINELRSDGNIQVFENDQSDLENGYRVWVNYNRESLKNAWNERSDFAFDGLGQTGNAIQYTLMRFLTSKGEMKTGESVESLTDEEVRAIEQGVTNYRLLKMTAIGRRVHELAYELSHYLYAKDPNGKSVSLRLEYARIALNMIAESPLFGIGTGDVKSAFKDYYANNETGIKEEFQKRAHNQFLTFALASGVIGFVLILLSWYFLMKYFQFNFYILSFFMVFLLSCLTEDTLETQTGVMFYCFFVCWSVLKDKTSNYSTGSPKS